MKKISIAILIITILFLIIWLCSLAKCEYLTYKYYEDFEYAYTENTMLDDMEYFKVLSCDGEYAEVYYVGKDMLCADILSFKKVKDEWIYDSWVDTVWSAGGSASEVIWPYWWHFIYGGF